MNKTGKFLNFFSTHTPVSLQNCLRRGLFLLMDSSIQVIPQIFFGITVRFRLWFGHTMTSSLFCASQSMVVLTLCFGSLSCWNRNFNPFSVFLQTSSGSSPESPCIWLIHLPFNFKFHSPFRWEMFPQHYATTMLHSRDGNVLVIGNVGFC